MKNKKKGTRILPSKDSKILIDNLSQKAFALNIAAKDKVEDEMLESRKRKITSKITIQNFSSNDIQFTEFDRAVLDAAIAERAKGNEYTTAAILFRHLGGKRLTENMRRAIIASLDKLASVRVIVESDAAVKKGIVDYGGVQKIHGNLLPTVILEQKINGQEVDAIKFSSDGIIFGNANLRDQIITCQQALLNAPVKSTPRNIALNHYLLRRSLSIKGSNELAESNKHVKPLCKVITFEDLYKHCGFDKDNKWQRQDARETTEKILKFLVEKEVIKNFEFIKKDGTFYSIEIFL